MRSSELKVAAAAIATIVLALPASAQTESPAPCPNPVEVQGFKTCADVAKAEQEGALVLYSPAPEPGTVKILAEFQAAFPKIKANYVRLQSGALYARLMSERQAGSYLADVLHLSDATLVLDFQGKKGFAPYASPQYASYKPEFKSKPEGFWSWGAIIMAGFAYNPNILSADKAPKKWPDILDPAFKDSVSVKSSNSGLQFLTWELLNRAQGEDFWKKFAESKPKAFDSYVQQFDRIVNGDDKLAVTAQYSGYLLYKQKGAPIEFIAPEDGLPAGPEIWGLASQAPHPEAARLFLDWFLSPLGQKLQADNIYLHSPRSDVAPPPGGKKIDDLKLMFLEETPELLQKRREFVKMWSAMSGLR
ncbi:ABC transporter substrate-binding protein [Microvirga sp. P5_D2]